jgi:hypothetical protein
MNMFRTLRADEIDCRIAQIKEKDGKPAGLSLLLYKDARCDQNILDETVGPMCWERKHSRENANCTVSIWCEERGCWVSKEDTGTESNTEKEKGLASDSFKRACFNWGIGRELYTAPFIWIAPDKCEFKKDGRGKWVCYDRFTVHGIGYTDGVITGLEIKNQKTGKICYTYGKIIEKAADKPEQPDTEPDAIPERPQAAPAAASVTEVDRVPEIGNKAAPAASETPGGFIKRRLKEITPELIDNFNFVNARKALIAGGVIEDVPSAVITMEQAQALIDALIRNFSRPEAS